MNQEQTFKRRLTRWSIRVLAVFLVALTCTFCFFSFESDKNVAEAAEETYNFKGDFNLTDSLFNDITSINQLTNGQSLYCFIYNPKSKRFLGDRPFLEPLRSYMHDITRLSNNSGASDDGSIKCRLWKLVARGGNYYSLHIASAITPYDDTDKDLVLDVPWGNPSQHLDLILYEDNGSDAQRWYIEQPTGTSTVTIRSKVDRNYAIAADGDAFDHGPNPQLDFYSGSDADQQFQILPIVQSFDNRALGYAASDFTSTIASRMSGKNVNASRSIVEPTTADTLWSFKTSTNTFLWTITNGSTYLDASYKYYYIVYSMNDYHGYNFMFAHNGALYMLRTNDYGTKFEHYYFSHGGLNQTFMFKIGQFNIVIKDVVVGSESGTPLDSTPDTKATSFNMKVSIPSKDYPGYTYTKYTTVNAYVDTLICYRIYTPNTYTVTYNGNGATSGSMNNSTHTYSIARNLSDVGFKKEYTVTLINNDGKGTSSTETYFYTFDGWNTKDDGSGTHYDPCESVSNLTTTNNGNVTLYAEWKATDHVLSDATRDGFTFYGWSEDDDPKKAPDITTSISGLITDKTYYAYWLKAESNVKDAPPENALFTADAGFYGDDKIENITGITTTYEWYRIGTDGETELEDFTGKTSCSVSEADKNHAIKCIVTIEAGDKTATNKAVSALYVGDTLVDATTMDDTNDYKNECFLDFEYKESNPSGNVHTFTFTDERFTELPISQMNLNISGDYSFSLYGLWGSDKVLIMSGTQDDSKMLLKADEGVSSEGELFASYELVVTTDTETIEKDQVKIRYIPRVYALLETNPIDATFEYLVKDGGYVQGCRTEREVITEVDGKQEIKVIKYFYDGDCIQIKLPVDSSKKLAAGSYILIGKEKVFPSASVPTDGYITIKYTNVLNYLLKGEEAIPIRFEEAELSVDLSKIATSDNSDSEDKNLNFGPLGGKIKPINEVSADGIQTDAESTYIRFGTVWYFDDIAATNTWSRDDAMGTFLLRLKTILRCADNTNDFYNYLLEKDKDFLDTMIDNRDGNGNLLSDFLEDNEEEILAKLNAFLAEWGAKGEKDDAFARKPSFGINDTSGKAILSDCKAKYYYYDENENGDYIMEYSAVLEVPSEMYDEKLIYIPYVSYVKGMEHWVVQKPDETTVYQLGSVKEVYTVNGFNKTPAEQ